MSLLTPGRITVSTSLLCGLLIGNGIAVGFVSYQCCRPVMLEGAECLGPNADVWHEIGYLQALPGLGALISTIVALTAIAILRLTTASNSEAE